MRNFFGKIPAMSLRVLNAVAPISIGSVTRLFKYNCASFNCALEVIVNAFHAHVQVLCCLTLPLWISVLGPRIPHHNDAVVADLHLGMRKFPIWDWMPQAKSKGLCEPIQRPA